jgi:signal transduction histidine kinase
MTEIDEFQAETQVLRVITVVLGISTLVFLALTWAPLTAETDFVIFAWQLASAIVVFGVPLVLAGLAFRLSRTTLKLVLGVYAVLFTVIALTFVPAMTAGPLPAGLAPWPLLVTAIGTVPAALAFSSPAAWTWLVLNSVAIAPGRFFASGGTDWSEPLQYAFFTITFAGIFSAIAAVAVANGRSLDAAASAARRTDANAAATLARDREHARIDALVHDEVIATLFHASQDVPALGDSVRRQATVALAHLARLRLPPGDSSAPVDANDFVAILRDTLASLSPNVALTVYGARVAAVPAEVAATLLDATTEAVRNSLAHAGGSESVTRTVTLHLTPRSIGVTILDSGTGFDPQSVPPTRLGIAVSITGRLAAIRGGSATVMSAPGQGTRVTLGWSSL